MRVVVLVDMMDKFNKKIHRFYLNNVMNSFDVYVSFNHERLFEIYKRATKKAKSIDSYIDNMDEMEKVIYEDNIVKPFQKFKS